MKKKQRKYTITLTEEQMLHQYTLTNKRKNVYTSETLRCEDSGEPIKITWEEK